MTREPNFCAECGETNVLPHEFYPPLADGACLCELCGDERQESAIDLEEQLEDAIFWHQIGV